MNQGVREKTLLQRQSSEENRQVSEIVHRSAVRHPKAPVMKRRRTLIEVEVNYRVVLFEEVRRWDIHTSERQRATAHLHTLNL